MVNQLQSQASPHEGFSIARKVMDDAVTFHLANGGPSVAREQIEHLANGLKFYDDISVAYRESMAKIAVAEKLLLQQAEERHQKEMQKLLFEVVGTLGPQQKSTREPPQLCDGELPPKLSSDRAMLMWQRLQQAGYIDEHYQPCKLSRAKSAVLADEMMNLLSNENERLTGSDDKWKPYETLWHRSNMKADHYRALNQVRISEFRAEIRKLLNGQR